MLYFLLSSLILSILHIFFLWVFLVIFLIMQLCAFPSCSLLVHSSFSHSLSLSFFPLSFPTVSPCLSSVLFSFSLSPPSLIPLVHYSLFILFFFHSHSFLLSPCPLSHLLLSFFSLCSLGPLFSILSHPLWLSSSYSLPLLSFHYSL